MFKFLKVAFFGISLFACFNAMALEVGSYLLCNDSASCCVTCKNDLDLQLCTEKLFKTCLFESVIARSP